MIDGIWFPYNISNKDTGVEVCEHISLPNAAERSGTPEYVSEIDIYCKECDEVYTFTELIN